MWDAVGDNIAEKRRLLNHLLLQFGASPAFIRRLTACTSPAAVNAFFVAETPSRSRKDVHSPGTWHLQRIASPEVGLDPNDMMAACQLKWAFKCKPDIVIQPSLGRGLGLELKNEAVEGRYPSSPSEKAILRGAWERLAAPKCLLNYVTQTEVQRKLMSVIFGDQGRVFLVSPRPFACSAPSILWRRSAQQTRNTKHPAAIRPSRLGCGSALTIGLADARLADVPVPHPRS